MDRAEAISALEGLYDTRPYGGEAVGLKRQLRSLRRLEGQLAVMRSELAGALQDSGAVPSVQDALAGEGGGTRTDTKREERQAKGRHNVPGLADAIGTGTASPAHAEAVGGALERLNQQGQAALLDDAEEIVEAAMTQSPHQFGLTMHHKERRARGETPADRIARQRAKRSLHRWVDTSDERMSCWLLKIDDITNACLEARFLAAANQLLRDRDGEHAVQYSDVRAIRNDQLSADAFTNLLLGEYNAAGNAGSGGPGAVIVITDPTILDTDHADHDHADGDDVAVAEDRADPTIGDVPVPPAEATRLLCDSDMWVTLLSATGVPLGVGRAQRCATPGQRALLRILHPNCGVAACTVGFDRCQIHHVRFWATQRGDTDIDHLIPVCSRHHHLIHDEHWTLTLNPDRSVDLRRPDGSLYSNAPPPNPPPSTVVPKPFQDLLRRWRDRRTHAARPSTAA